MTWSSNEFHFLKVELGIDSCEEVAAIERSKHGPEYLWLWIRLALKYANYGGVLCRRIGENVLPVTADDLEAEFKGGFSDVSIKDGVARLIQGSLIYINSDGFMAITGLTISGDPKEPVLHRQNSTEKCFRPVSIGNDTKNAQYQRARRNALKEKIRHPELMAPGGNMMSYSEISDKASCSKQTVINRIKSLGWTEHIQMIGQKAMVPHSISQYLIAVIQDHPVRTEILESLRLDGYHFDGFDGYHTPSNTVKQPSNEPSNTVKQPSNDGAENPHDEQGLDGLSNENPSEILDDKLPLIESSRNKEIQEDIYNTCNETVKIRQRMKELYHVGFDKNPDDSELSLLYNMYRTTPYSVLLSALKTARRFKGDSVAYAKQCILRDRQADIVSDDDLKPSQRVALDRDISKIENIADDEFGCRYNPETVAAVKEALRKYSDYYTDDELIDCMRNLSAHQECSVTGVDFFICHTDYSTDDNEAIEKIWQNMKERNC